VTHIHSVCFLAWCRYTKYYKTSNWKGSRCDLADQHSSSGIVNDFDAHGCDRQQQSDSNGLHAFNKINTTTVNAAVQMHNVADVQHNNAEALQAIAATDTDTVVVHEPLATQLYSMISAATSGMSLNTMLQKLSSVYTEAAVQDALTELQLDISIYCTDGNYFCI
jgi:hypothetical protein